MHGLGNMVCFQWCNACALTYTPSEAVVGVRPYQPLRLRDILGDISKLCELHQTGPLHAERNGH